MKYILLVLLPLLSFSVWADDESVDCNNAISTLDINYCAVAELNDAKAELNQYLTTSYDYNKEDAELVKAIKVAQEDWEKYRTSHCDSVYTAWREGSIRNVMATTCETKLTKQRTHELWENFLESMDSSPSVLPEPKM